MVNSLIGSRTAPKTVCCAPISFLSTFLSRFLRPWFLDSCRIPSGNSLESGKCWTLFVNELQEEQEQKIALCFKKVQWESKGASATTGFGKSAGYEPRYVKSYLFIVLSSSLWSVVMSPNGLEFFLPVLQWFSDLISRTVQLTRCPRVPGCFPLSW